MMSSDTMRVVNVEAAGRAEGIPHWPFYIAFAMFRLTFFQGVKARHVLKRSLVGSLAGIAGFTLVEHVGCSTQ